MNSKYSIGVWNLWNIIDYVIHNGVWRDISKGVINIEQERLIYSL